MLKIVFFILAIAVASLYAVSLDIKADNNVHVTQEEAKYFQSALKKEQGIHIDEKESERVLKVNRVLSNAWLQEGGYDKVEQMKIRRDLERAFTEKLIHKHFGKLEITEDILLSYYLDNKKEFILGTKIHFDAYTFDAFKPALDFYEHFKDNRNGLQGYVKEHNITIRTSDENTLATLHPALLNMLVDNNTTDYFTTPARFKNKFVVLDIIDFTPNAKAPFNTVKEQIKKKLYYKKKSDVRNALLEKYMKEGQ